MSHLDHIPQDPDHITQKAKNLTYPYMHFGMKLYMRRSRLKNRNKETAEKYSVKTAAKILEIDKDHYRAIECGKMLPEGRLIAKLASFLEMDIPRLVNWCQYARNKAQIKSESDASAHNALNYTSDWELALSSFKKWYCAAHDCDELTPRLAKTLKRLEQDVHRIYKLPLLPMPLFLMLSTFLEESAGKTHLYEIPQIVFEGEHMAAYLERDPYLGPFALYVANKTFWCQSPKSTLRDCLNTLTIEQFRVILFLAFELGGLYGFSNDLSVLQRYHEFNSHGVLLARLLKKRLKDEFPGNYDHLSMGLAMQGLGTYAFFSILKPSLSHDEIPARGDVKQESYKELDPDILDRINYDFHPVVSGMIAANWGFDKDLVRLLIDHHEPLSADTTPTCAMLKLINHFTDHDFEASDRQQIEDKLAQFSQLNISADALFETLCEMEVLKDKIVEESSSVIVQRSVEASEVTQTRIKTMMSSNKPVQAGVARIYEIPNESAFRFDPHYQRALINEDHVLLSAFRSQVTALQKGESLEKYGERMKNLQLALMALSFPDHDNIAERAHLTVDEIRNRLIRLGG